MALAQEVLHVIDIGGGKKITVMQPDVYSAIGTLVGVKKATEAEIDSANYEEVTAAIKTGKVVRFKVRMKIALSGKEVTRTRRLLASTTAVMNGGLGKITGKVIGDGQAVGNGYIPVRRTFKG